MRTVPELCLILASAASETLLSAVTTTRPVVAAACQAIPATPVRSTASLVAASWPALYEMCAAEAAPGRARAPAARAPAAAAISRAMWRRAWTALIIVSSLKAGGWRVVHRHPDAMRQAFTHIDKIA